jgi:hypothetical protein
VQSVCERPEGTTDSGLAAYALGADVRGAPESRRRAPTSAGQGGRTSLPGSRGSLQQLIMELLGWSAWAGSTFGQSVVQHIVAAVSFGMVYSGLDAASLPAPIAHLSCVCCGCCIREGPNQLSMPS